MSLRYFCGSYRTFIREYVSVDVIYECISADIHMLQYISDTTHVYASIDEWYFESHTFTRWYMCVSFRYNVQVQVSVDMDEENEMGLM